jgi:hypothetical protein
MKEADKTERQQWFYSDPSSSLNECVDVNAQYIKPLAASDKVATFELFYSLIFSISLPSFLSFLPLQIVRLFLAYPPLRK